MYGNKEEGKELYLIHCANCHSITMMDGLGKDFNIVSYTRTRDEIKLYMKSPWKYFRQFGYSANAMPTLPLDDSEIEHIADYIDSLQPFKKWMKK
jgi:mono/diheme cytochrome c family protein